MLSADSDKPEWSKVLALVLNEWHLRIEWMRYGSRKLESRLYNTSIINIWVFLTASNLPSSEWYVDADRLCMTCSLHYTVIPLWAAVGTLYRARHAMDIISYSKQAASSNKSILQIFIISVGMPSCSNFYSHKCHSARRPIWRPADNTAAVSFWW